MDLNPNNSYKTKKNFQGQIVWKPLNVNPGLNVNWSIMFSCLKMFSPLMCGAVWDYYISNLKGKQYKQNTSPRNRKTEIKILANPGLA